MSRRRLNYIGLVPKEILSDNIFTRLPVKSVGQCKCVSKPWNSLISDPHFAKTHLTTTCNDDAHNNTKTILISRNPDPGLFYSVSLTNNPDKTGSSLKFDCSDNWSRIWGSCDGLVLAHRDMTWTNMYLLNPTTLEFKKLPVLPSLRSKYKNNKDYIFGFGYDSLSDDYAIVAISYWPYGLIKVVHVYVYMLKKNYWDKVGLSPHDYRYCKGRSGMFVGGCLHWLVKNVDDSSWLISAFTIANKEFSQVPVPAEVFDSRWLPRLGVFKGCLCLINMKMMISEIWVMKEYDVLESWIKFSFNGNPQVPLHLQENNFVDMDIGGSALVVTNLEEAKPYNSTKVIISRSTTEVGMTYVESLVSPNNKDALQKKEKRTRRSKTIK